MKKICLLIGLFICCFFIQKADAACGTGQSEVIISIVPDNYPDESSWSLRDATTNALIDTGTINSDTICLGNTQCVKFTMFDTYGDGLCCTYGTGSYSIRLNGTQVATGGSFTYSESVFFNCPPGYSCASAIVAVEDTMLAAAPETWYVFTPDSTGRYDIKTCALGNTCDPIIYIYDHCAGIITAENNTGTVFYNDDACAGNQSRIEAAMVVGTVYYIRIGDYQTSCVNHTITWQILFEGPIMGCTDSNSCTYNPLATVDTGGCVYPPSPLCPAPDLMVVGTEIESSLSIDNLNAGATNCYVGEGCLTGYGDRRLIRFTTHIKNIGTQDYYIGAPDTVGNQFTFDACHNHWHYVGYAEYLLYDHNYLPVQAGYKNGFCVLDLECSGGGQAKFGCGNMGITAGCGDIYSAGLNCQWLDITTVDTGNYTLVVRVNWDQSPDKLGHYESRYDNNWAQVCLHIYYDGSGLKVFEQLPNCPVYVDCAGDTLGNAVVDCAGTCNGSSVRGDVDVNLTANAIDETLYLDGLTQETLPYTVCNDLNGDNQMTVTDAARLNGCLLYNAGQHQHPNGGGMNNHKHCEFPFNVINIFDTVEISIADTNLSAHYVDLSIYNPNCQVEAYEFKLHGLIVDSVRNLATGNYSPDIRSSSTGHIVGITLDENSLYRQLVPLNFIRVYFDTLTDTQICVQQIIAIVNSDYDEVIGRVGGTCFNVSRSHLDTTITTLADEITSADLSVVPNPSSGVFDLYLSNKSLYGASIKVFDAIGQVVFETHFNNGLSNSYRIDLENEQSGLYVAQINWKGKSLSKRMMLVRK